ncbi:ankyrin repeat domain-containing protein [Croceitalea marina]|uniref:Ankyrin repeat domain-containing protein n=1 Tax=Croceitalea marina TaxID=1775166 RepID=A0ABW5N340_9FLAO
MKTISTLKFAFTLLAVLFLSCKGQTSTEKSSGQDYSNVELQEAIISGNVEAVKYHIKVGSDFNEKDSFTGSTPLMTAATFGKTEIAKLLIEAKVDLNIQNNEGSTALHNAAFFCRQEIVKNLLEHGADKTIKNNYASTPLASVEAPYAEVEGIYSYIKEQLSPLGLELDIVRIKETRPVIVNILK